MANESPRLQRAVSASFWTFSPATAREGPLCFQCLGFCIEDNEGFEHNIPHPCCLISIHAASWLPEHHQELPLICKPESSLQTTMHYELMPRDMQLLLCLTP